MAHTQHDDLLKEAIAAARRGNKTQTRSLLHTVLEMEPRNEVALLWLASVAASPAEGVVFLEKVLNINPTNPRALEGVLSYRLQMGIEAAKAKRRTDARRLLMMVVNQDPENEQALLWLAGVAQSSREATEYLHRVLRINPDSSQAKAGLEWYRERQAKKQGAPAWECPICRKKASIAAHRCVACKSVVSLEAIDLFWTDEPVDAVALNEAQGRLERAIRTNPRDGEMRRNLAMVYFNLRQFAEGYVQLHAAHRILSKDTGLKKLADLWADRIRQEALQQKEKQKSRQLTILAVDDSATVRKLVCVTLERQGHRVIEAADGYAALASLQSSGMPDLILLDIMMPGIDGYQVCKMLRQNAEMAKRPIIMLSGKDGFFSKIRGRMAGSTEYVTKPFKPEALVELVEKYYPADKN